MLSRILHWLSRVLVFLSTFVVVLLACLIYVGPFLCSDNNGSHTDPNQTFTNVARELGTDESDARTSLEQ
jgi:hypothetical protein